MLSTRVVITTRPQSRTRFFQQQFVGGGAIREGRNSRLRVGFAYLLTLQKTDGRMRIQNLFDLPFQDPVGLTRGELPN